uniref:Uncharacterized protein n=1 Tax=Manihot esculenta TaxID=3983 RepID=A0A251L0S9_MANES
MLERTEVYIAVILMRIREWSRIKGCICSKGTASNEYVEKSAASKEATKTSKLSVSSSKRDEAAFEVDDISNQLNGSSTFVSSDENKKQSAKASPLKACRLLSLTNGDKKKHKLLLVGLLG